MPPGVGIAQFTERAVPAQHCRSAAPGANRGEAPLLRVGEGAPLAATLPADANAFAMAEFGSCRLGQAQRAQPARLSDEKQKVASINTIVRKLARDDLREWTGDTMLKRGKGYVKRIDRLSRTIDSVQDLTRTLITGCPGGVHRKLIRAVISNGKP